MIKKILIDAFYPEETKFILLDSTEKLEEFDYQNSYKKSIKGNIYLGKVDRIEPSLQAAFINYGNEKKGFLSFEMIHPKYYQIPAADKEKLIEKIKETEVKSEANANLQSVGIVSKNKDYLYKNKEFYNNYKIQEVIKKDQILLIQVEKEERGNKGAFLTTYISLSGRYCVFSPNSIKNSCGISRKLDDQKEKERLKDLSNELLKNYQNTSLILRTSCAYKTKAEINRDFNSLTSIWENIKISAISSYAPALIYEVGDLLINGIKDFYTSEVGKIIVSGHEAYEKIYEFLKIFIPNSIQKLEEHTKISPILHVHKVESQLQELYLNKVKLKSGGYLIINTTEALISIDVNSGTYTEEYTIENTALNINLEATIEIARQIKFRGLSGLIVIDFIDMLDLQNKILVEKQLKKCFWQDKAKIQLGKISDFGLLEMSRQRIGRSFIESNSVNCTTCLGKGHIILKSSIALLLMGKLKILISKKATKFINIFTTTDIMIYLINNCKGELSSLENSFNIQINLYIDDIITPEEFKITFGRFKTLEMKNKRYDIPNNLDIRNNVQNLKTNNILKRFDNSENYKKQKSNPQKTFITKKVLRKYKNINTGKSNVKQKNIKDKITSKQNNKSSNTSSMLKKIWTKITG